MDKGAVCVRLKHLYINYGIPKFAHAVFNKPNIELMSIMKKTKTEGNRKYDDGEMGFVLV